MKLDLLFGQVFFLSNRYTLGIVFDANLLSAEALDDLRAMITENYGAAKVPDEARRFKTKSKNAQEAHEAIRPASASIRPAQLKVHLKGALNVGISRKEIKEMAIHLAHYGGWPASMTAMSVVEEVFKEVDAETRAERAAKRKTTTRKKKTTTKRKTSSKKKKKKA